MKHDRWKQAHFVRVLNPSQERLPSTVRFECNRTPDMSRSSIVARLGLANFEGAIAYLEIAQGGTKMSTSAHLRNCLPFDGWSARS